MKPRVYLTVFLLLLPLQASLFGPLSLGGVTPDLGLAVLYCIGLMTGPVEAALAGIAIGLLQDLGSASLIGFSGLTRGIMGLAVGFLGRRVLDIQSPSNLVFLLVFCLAEALFSRSSWSSPTARCRSWPLLRPNGPPGDHHRPDRIRTPPVHDRQEHPLVDAAPASCRRNCNNKHQETKDKSQIIFQYHRACPPVWNLPFGA